MDHKFIKQYISNCPIMNFSEEGNTEERQKQFEDYLESSTQNIYKNENLYVQCFWEEGLGATQIYSIKQLPLLRRVILFFDVSISVYNFVAKKYIQNRSSTKTADLLSVHLQYSFNLLKSLIVLALNGCYYSVISEYRTMYESFVISKYLLLHPELVPAYKKHSELTSLKINRMTVGFPKDQEERYKKIVEEYGCDFEKDYGWTKEVIKNAKDRKLITLANECEVDSFFSSLYKMSCEYVHPSSLAATTKADLNIIKPFLQVAMYIIENEINDFLSECNVVTREAVLLDNLILKLFDDSNCDFFSEKKENKE